MDKQMLTYVIGILASVLIALSLVPQLKRVVAEKKAKDISIGTLIILFIAQSLWISYGALKTDWIIIGSNVISLVVNCFMIFFSVRYRNS